MILRSVIWWLLGIAALYLAVFWGLFLFRVIIPGYKRSRLPARERLVDFLKTNRSMLAHAKIDVDSYLATIEQEGAMVAVTTMLEQTESLPPGYWKFLFGVKKELERKG